MSNVEKGAFLVSVLDSTGISQKSRGIIGQFVREDAYAIQTDGQTDEEGNKIGQILAGWDFYNVFTVEHWKKIMSDFKKTCNYSPI